MKKLYLLFLIGINIFNVHSQEILVNSEYLGWHDFELEANKNYSLNIDFSNHNFDSDGGELDGWRQNYSIDWNGKVIDYLIEANDKTNPDLMIPKSMIGIKTKSAGIIKYKTKDNDFSDNTGNVILNLYEGNTQINGIKSTINAGDANWKTFELAPNETYILTVDFTNHNFDNDEGELNGWRQNYSIDWNGSIVNYSFEEGIMSNPDFLIPFSQFVLKTKKESTIKFKVRDASYGDNSGYVEIFLTKMIINSLKEKDLNIINIYPNPTTDYIYISNCSPEKVSIINLSGGLIQTYNNLSKIDLSSFKTGMYIININTLSGNIIKQKIVKK